MSLFNPEKTRKALLDVVLPMELHEQIETYQPDAVGNAAIHRLHGVIEAWLVGLEREFQPVLEVTNEWLYASVQVREQFGMNEYYHGSQKWEALALSKWMLTGSTCTDSLENALAAKEEAWVHERRLRGEVSAQDLIQADLPDYIAICMQLHRPECGLTQLKSQSAMLNMDEGLQFLSVACESLANGSINSATFDSLRSKFLAKKLQSDWLAHGQNVRAANWLKTLLWHDAAKLSPISTVRLAYAYMPNVAALHA